MITEKEIDDSMDVSSARLGLYEILLVTLGFLGIHRFYVKRYITGAIILVSDLLLTANGFFNIPYVSIPLDIIVYGFIILDLSSAVWGFSTDSQNRPLREDSTSKDSEIALIIISVILIAILVAYPLFGTLYIVQLIVYAIAWIFYLIKNIKEILA